MDATPPAAPPAINDDLQQLKLLSIFHYVLAGIVALFSLFPILHLVMGIAVLTGAMPLENGDPNAQPMDAQVFGWIFVAIAVVLITMGMALAGCIAYAGRCIARRRNHLFCLIVAGVSCMFMPLGTVLGVFTLVVLLRPSVKPLFAPGAPA